MNFENRWAHSSTTVFYKLHRDKQYDKLLFICCLHLFTWNYNQNSIVKKNQLECLRVVMKMLESILQVPTIKKDIKFTWSSIIKVYFCLFFCWQVNKILYPIKIQRNSANIPKSECKCNFVCPSCLQTILVHLISVRYTNSQSVNKSCLLFVYITTTQHSKQYSDKQTLGNMDALM